MTTFWLLRKIFGWLLEDSGYPRALKELWFLYSVNQEEVIYKEAHGKTCMIVEKSFGVLVLKSIFR